MSIWSIFLSISSSDKPAKDALDALTAEMIDSFRASPLDSEMRSINRFLWNLRPGGQPFVSDVRSFFSVLFPKTEY